jgi:hypothetical protein
VKAIFMLGHILKTMTIPHFRMYKNILNLASEMGAATHMQPESKVGT